MTIANEKDDSDKWQKSPQPLLVFQLRPKSYSNNKNKDKPDTKQQSTKTQTKYYPKEWCKWKDKCTNLSRNGKCSKRHTGSEMRTLMKKFRDRKRYKDKAHSDRRPNPRERERGTRDKNRGFDRNKRGRDYRPRDKGRGQGGGYKGRDYNRSGGGCGGREKNYNDDCADQYN